MGKYKEVYDRRWSSSRGTKDDDIFALENPVRQVEFFYYNYNVFISRVLSEVLGDCRGKKLLEIGCGRATSSIYQALKLGISVVPTDYSEEALKIAKRNLRKYGVVADPKKEDLYHMSFDDESFDAVISLGVMEHIEEPEMAYREMQRVLKKGGVMISMNVPECPDNIQRIAIPINRMLIKLERFFSKKESKPWLDKESRSKTADVYRSTLRGEEFARVVKKSGFNAIRAVEVNSFPTIDPVPEYLDRLIVKFYKVVMMFREITLRMENPFVCSARNSRAHFIVAHKGDRK